MLLRRSAHLLRKPAVLPFSTAAEPKIQLEDFRTNVTSPNDHTIEHLGKFYRIAPEAKKQLFTHGGIPKSYEQQFKTFGESCLMVRKPALEIMHYIKNCDLKNPVVRYVLYGKDGVGKSMTMAHLLHYGMTNDFILVHVPWVPNWYKKPKETAPSTTREGFVDLPLDAAAWLIHFKNQNASLLAKLDLKCSKDYVWNKRETTAAGASLMELVEHGISRVKFASDTISALIDELKVASSSGKCKTMVAIDGFNAFFYPVTHIHGENRVKITTDKITLTDIFVKATNYDWTNGVCLVTVDRLALKEDRWESELPRYLLDKEGFEHLDPFVPILVENYTDKEIHSCIDYYLDRRWIQNVSDGFDKELKFLSGNNPFKFMELCAPL